MRTAELLTSRWTLLSVGNLLFWLATQALRPYVPIYIGSLGVSASTVGFVVAAHPFLSLFLAIPAGRLIDVRGMRRVIMISFAAMSVVGAAYTIATSAVQIAGLQAIAGLSELGAWVGMQSLVTRIGGEDQKRLHLGLFSIVWGLGVAAGPTLGAYVYDSLGFGSIGLLYSACAISALLALIGVPHKDHGGGAPDDAMGQGQSLPILRRIFEVSRKSAVLATITASFVMLWGNSLRSSFYPLYLEQAGLPVPTIGYIMSVSGFALLLIRFSLPWMLSRLTAATVLLFGALVAVVALVITPLIVTSILALWVASAFFGVGVGLASPMTIDLISVNTALYERGLAMGMRVASNRLAQLVQPIVFGVVATAFGMAVGFGVAGLVMGGALAGSACGLKRNGDRG